MFQMCSFGTNPRLGYKEILFPSSTVSGKPHKLKELPGGSPNHLQVSLLSSVRGCTIYDSSWFPATLEAFPPL